MLAFYTSVGPLPLLAAVLFFLDNLERELNDLVDSLVTNESRKVLLK